MPQKDISPAKLAAMYTARMIVGRNAPAARELQKHTGWAEQTIIGRIKKLSDEDIRSRLLQLADAEGPTPTLDEHIQIAELKRDLKDAKARADRLALELGEARNIRDGILAVSAEPLAPRRITASQAKRNSMTWMICLSDNHLGKRFTAEEVSGLQSYDVEIARNRIRRTFSQALKLIRLNASPVHRVIVACLGDNVNGALRHDDDRSNEIGPFRQARVFAECARDGIDLLLSELTCDIDVVVLPGNHGRNTANPPSVEISENFDCLAGGFLEWHYHAEKRVHVSNTGQADSLLDIYGRGYLLTHGDRIGASGGDGQIGALGPTKRGALRIGAQELEIGKYLAERPDLAAVIMGHYHYQWTDLSVFVSGPGIGPEPYSHHSNRMRAVPRPPTQWLLGMEADKGLIEAKWLFVGHPDEGPICAFGKAA